MTDVVTIGVYGFSVDDFLAELAVAGVTTVFDIRQRRGVRGAEYAWANSQRLQRVLATAGIAYEHHKELAPTTELRQLQYAADARNGVGKRSRRRLDPEYRRRYVQEVLDRVDLTEMMAATSTTAVIALLCVEAEAQACHRSVVAARLARLPGVRVHAPTFEAGGAPAGADRAVRPQDGRVTTSRRSGRRNAAG